MKKPVQEFLKRPETKFEHWALNMPRAQLGGLIKEYVAESNHNSWDGFDRHDLTGIRKFLTDLMIYHDNHDDRFGLATKVSNVNPVP
jgi:hypothetical protein